MKICLFCKKNKVTPGKVFIDKNGEKKQYIYNNNKKLILVPYNNSSISSLHSSRLSSIVVKI
jgi:hypothetical protein